MLDSGQRDRLELVLVRPRNPLNIGAVARAMANFGLDRLTVVDPWAPHWREARSAVGAPELLEKARETATLLEAVRESTLVLGTGSLEYRRPEQRVIALPEAGPPICGELEAGGQVTLVFGPEKHGLTREDLSLCHALVEIPTDPRQPSMNLGQAVAVCLYEVAVRGAAEGCEPHTQPAGARSETLERLGELVESTMRAAQYSPAAMQEANRHDLRVLLRKLAIEENDARRLLGFFRRVLWRLGKV